MMQEEHLRTLASIYGIATEYWNIRGERIQVPRKTLVALLRAMGVEDFSPEGLRETAALARAQKSALDFAVRILRRRTKRLRVPPSFVGGEARISNEHGEVVFRSRVTSPLLSVTLPPECPWGYYNLTIASSNGEFSSLLILSPLKAYLPPERIWGIHGALFALTTGRNQGIGDLRDLKDLQDLVVRAGGHFLGLLPLHLMPKDGPQGISPYSAFSRRLFDPIYLPLDEVLLLFPGLSLPLPPDPDPSGNLIDYELVWREKDRFLRKVFRHFFEKRTETFAALWGEFQNFLDCEKDRVIWASLYQAIASEAGPNWRKWPAPLRERNEKALRDFFQTHEQDVLYFASLEWLMHRFLESITEKYRILCFDIPVGCAPSGIESWLCQERLAFDFTVGAPPDDFSPEGQNWGFHPFSPRKIRENRYADFIALLRDNMRFARFVRLDHIMGLKRLFWIPEGGKPSEGTYVQYPFRELLAILTLESVKNGVVLIGEDLGTVPRFLRSVLRRSAMLSTRVFYFEREDSSPRHPQEYPRESYATLNTHDMPPFLAFLEGRDILLRKDLGIFTPEQAAVLLEDRKHFLEECLKKLREWGFLQEDNPTPQALLFALFRFLAATPSRVVSVSLDDLLESTTQVNLPGTVEEYPNWRCRLPLRWERLKERLTYLATVFSFEGGKADDAQSL
ncbi:4-alpha-glucanotransferase [Candidatus Caldatribacterium sp. SIUC1]|uniref:4-alpha-glucanotransferase n=1 Tax=Candidatus Caldatribacterium sp. SIUC1 TaxID=3418365 RepID=UPI003F68FC75